ncbi:MAG TPA: hypothetical protein VJH87_17220, partial [Vicinamibacteria bacterium]|nr:hypothetical protein [Vicinamibacteria bacterium]
MKTIFLLATLSAAAPPPDSGSLLVRCGRLIDGLSDDARTEVQIYIANGKIEAVGKDLQVP